MNGVWFSLSLFFPPSNINKKISNSNTFCPSAGVPFGMSLWGTAFSEPTLIKYGSALEDLFRARVTPTFHDFGATNIPINFEYGAYFSSWPDLSKFHF